MTIPQEVQHKEDKNNDSFFQDLIFGKHGISPASKF